MIDATRYKLHFGPYQAPKVVWGDLLSCEIRGQVTVGYFSNGKIPWPCVQRPGHLSPILCGDLAKALRCESLTAVCHWWGVTLQTGIKWRKALGVTGYNEGGNRLREERFKEWRPRRHWEKALAVAHDPVRCTRQRRSEPPRRGRIWTPQEDALLGTMRDQDLAGILGCSKMTVANRRWKLRIEAFVKAPPREGRLAVSPKKLTALRLALHLSQAEVGQRADVPYGSIERGERRYVTQAKVVLLAAVLKCRLQDFVLKTQPHVPTVPDDSLLGEVPDVELARTWRITDDRIRKRRQELGIPAMTRARRLARDKRLRERR
jgi:transcriptional regulator with XRE-family HTH domain